MAKLSQIKELKFYPAFGLLMIICAITLSRFSMILTERTLLPRIHPSSQPLRVTNNDGTLSNGQKLAGRQKTLFFCVSGLVWMISCVIVSILVLRIWPVEVEQRNS